MSLKVVHIKKPLKRKSKRGMEVDAHCWLGQVGGGSTGFGERIN